MADSAQQTLVKVGPNGEISYDFDGHISAQGIDLLASTISTEPDDRKVRWLRESDGAMVAELAAKDVPTALGSSPPMRYQLRARASDPTDPTRYGELAALVQDTGTIANVQARAAYGGAEQLRLIVDHEARSSFLQLGGASAKKSLAGRVAVTWPGGSPQSDPVQVNHTLGNNALVIVTASLTDATGHHVAAYARNTSATYVVLGASSFTGNPAAGAACQLDYILIEA